MKSCVVTVTGGRPELFALCRRWVERCKPDHWLVVCDMRNGGLEGYDIGSADVFSIITQTNYNSATQRAHALLSKGLQEVPPDHCAIIMEDDDWYPHDYVDILHGMLVCTADDIVGCKAEWRYHVPAARWTAHATKTPNAGSTAIAPHAIEDYRRILLGKHGADNRAFTELKSHITLNTHRVSIKGVGYGLPGRKGATTKHDPDTKKVKLMTPDPSYAVLKNWLGHDDANAYMELLCNKPSA